jgi:transcriptional regulator with XRE-family HTH domain
MNSRGNKQNTGSKPYPRRCAECGEVTVQRAVIPYDAQVKHDGKLHEFHIAKLPVDQCTSCSEVYFTNITADAKARALRQHLGLLQPDEIRELLSRHRLTQRKLAEHLRVAEESVSRWINGQSIQSRALDAFMRVYFAIPQVREMLARGGDSDGPHEPPSNIPVTQLPSAHDRGIGMNSDVHLPPRAVRP